jgi:H+/Cl- antiporter ClcA
MKKNSDRLWKILGNTMLVLAVLATLYIMASGLGLIDSLDFGAGAYYYADIPNFQRYVNSGAYTSPVPMWVLIVLFLAWGYLMYRLWLWIDKKTGR